MKKLEASIRLAHKILGKRIKRLRQKKGMSQADFAAKCGIGLRYVVKIELGESSLPFSLIQEIAKNLDVTLVALLKGIE